MRLIILLVLILLVLLLFSCSSVPSVYSTPMCYNPICLSGNTGINPDIKAENVDIFKGQCEGTYSWTLGMSTDTSRNNVWKSTTESESAYERNSNIYKMAAKATQSNPDRAVKNVRIAAKSYGINGYWVYFQASNKMSAKGDVIQASK